MRKKTIITICILLTTASLFSQNIVMQEDLKNIIQEDFSGEKSSFPILTSKDNYFIIDNGDYLLSRNNTQTEYAILSTSAEFISDFRLRSSIKLGPSSNKRSSAGLILKVQAGGALVFEINRKSEFRVKELLSNNTYKYLSGKSSNDGWVKNKTIKKEDEYNSIEIRCVSNVFDIYVNNTFMTTLFSPNLKEGRMGFIISRDAKARISYYYLDVPAEAKNNLIEKQIENNTLESLTNTKQELESKTNSLTQTNERLDQENNKLKEEIRLLKNDNTLESISQKYQKSKKTIDSLNNTLSILKTNIEETNKLLSNEKVNIKSARSEIENRNEIIQNLNLEIQNQNQSSANKISSLENKIKEVSQELKNLNDELSSSYEKMFTFEKEIDQLNDLNNNLNKTNNSLKSTNQNLNDQLSSNEKDLKSKKNEITSLQNNNTIISKEINEKKSEISKLDVKINSINSLAKDRLNEISKLKKNLLDKSSETSKLNIEVSGLKEELNIIENSKVKPLEKKVTTLLSEKEVLIESENKQKNEIQILTSKLEDLHKKTENMKEVLIYKGFEEKGIISENIQAENAEKLESVTNKDITYSVQIATYGSKVNIQQFRGLLDVFYYDTNNNTFLYMSGKFNNSNEATEHKNKLIQMGYSNAFVVQLNNK